VNALVRANVLEFYQNSYIRHDLLEIMKFWLPQKLILPKSFGTKNPKLLQYSEMVSTLREKYHNQKKIFEFAVSEIFSLSIEPLTKVHHDRHLFIKNLIVML
jgi:hypothetical protein